MGLRAFCEHITAHTGETIRIELDSAGYSGSPLELIGTGRSPLWFSHEYEQLNKANVYDTIIQKSYAEFNFHNRGSAEQTLLDEILSATEGTFKLTKKINGTVDWVGVVLGDLSGFNDGEATPFPVKIVAKDFTPLSGTLFAEFSLRKTIAKVVAEIVGTLGYSLPIHTRTSWVTSDTDANNDFMRQVFVGGFPLTDRDNLDPVLITNEEALNRLLSPYKCIIKITNGVFLIDQLSAYSTPTSVLTTVYDTNGDFVSQSNVNTVISANTNVKVVTGSVNEIKPAYKRVRATYNHRTNISGIILPEDIQPGFTGPPEALVDDPVIFSQDFVADGTTSISLNGVVVVKPLPTFVINQDIPPVARIEIKVNYSGGSYWFDINADTWQTSQVINIIRLDGTGRGIVFTGTTPVPQFPASTQLQCLFYASDVQPPSTTNYLYFILDLVSDNKPATQNSIQYELVQAGQFSNEFDSGAFWFGDGPTAFSPSALTRSTLSTDLTTTWQRRGTTPNRPMHENLLAEIMDSHRSYGRMLDAILRDGTYSPYNSLSYDLLSFYFIGGSFDAYTGEWQITAIQNAFFTSVTDTLNVGVISGPSLITSGLFTAARLASNNAIEASGGYSFRTALNLSGTVTQIFVQSVGTTSPQLSKDSVIRIVHPVTLQDFDFVVREDMIGGSSIIPVVSTVVDGVIPVGSWVFTNAADASTAIIIGRNAIQAISRSTATGELATAVNGVVSSLDIVLFQPITKNEEFTLYNPDNGVDYVVVVKDDYNVGRFNIDIEPELITAPIGSYLWGDESIKQTLQTWNPGHIISSVTRERKANDIALVRTEIQSGSPITSIPIKNARSMTLRDGMKLNILNRDGTNEEFTVNGEQILTGASTGITVNSQTPLFDYDIDADVQEPSGAASSVISQQAGTIVLKATTSSGSINKLALIRLDADAVTGSAILLQADQITVVGQTTFLNALVSNGIASRTGVNARIRATTAPTVRDDGSALVQGDEWIKTNEGNLPHTWSGSAWIRDYTIIDGGNITTGTINANLVKVQNSATNPDVVIDGTGITLLQNDGTNDTEIKRSVHWINTTNTTNQARLVSYSGMATRNVAIDAAGFDDERAFRFSVRRNISGNQDLSIGIAGQTNDFVSGSAQGDAVVSVSNGNLFLNNTIIIPTSGNSTGSTSGALRVTGGAYFGGNSFHTGTFTLANSLIIGTDTNKATIQYTANVARTYTIPNSGLNANFVMTEGAQNIGGQKNFADDTTVQRLKVGLFVNNATIEYTTNTARTLTIPNVGGNRTFAFINQAQTFSANQTFTGNVIVPNSTTGTHALNVTTGDGRYGRLGAANVFTGAQRFTNASFSLESLPTSDPGITGRIWNDSGTLKVSP